LNEKGEEATTKKRRRGNRFWSTQRTIIDLAVSKKKGSGGEILKRETW